jgi:acyl carrier protein
LKIKPGARLIGLLMAISGRDRSDISTPSTFQEQGFDSLSLTQVAFAVEEKFSTKVEFWQLMDEFPNVDLLAEHLDATLPRDVLTEVPAIQAGPSQPQQLGTVAEQEKAGVRVPVSAAPDVDAVLSETQPQADPLQQPSTIAQRAILVASCDSIGQSASYNESVTVRFTGNISAAKMACAIERLVDRHEALRASFDEAGLTMRIDPTLRIAMPVIDLSARHNEPVEQQARLRELIEDEVVSPFPLPEGPLFRSQMILLASDHAAVILTAHLAICDGWSMDVLIHDLCAFYSEELSRAAASLAAAESYLKYIHDVMDRASSDLFKTAWRYWHERFAEGFPTLELPIDHPRRSRREFKARRIDYSISNSVLLDLRSVGAKQGCSLFASLVSTLAILFARISQQRRFVIALPTAEQPVMGRQGLVGHCVNLLPFDVELREDESFSAFLKRTQRDLFAAQQHAVYTMDSLLADLRLSGQIPGLSAVTASFSHARKFRPGELPQSGFQVDYELNPKGYESFEFYLNAFEAEESLDLQCHFDAMLFDDLTIQKWLAMLGSIIQTFSEDPSRDTLSHDPSEGLNDQTLPDRVPYPNGDYASVGYSPGAD